ncbi:MAG: aldehyde ferredoxin oxidoreductase family protein [Candidatus Brocadiia bacterium]
MHGYAGKLLEVDLTAGTTADVPLDEAAARRFIGGSGLGAWLLHQRAPDRPEPLSPANPLIFLTGPFTGTRIPTSSRHAIVSRSPLTGIWGEADVGGAWGTGLKKAGYDGLIVVGQAASPVYLWVHDGEAEARDAEALWGTDTYAAAPALKDQTSEKASVACIGPAGEALVRYASVMHGGKRARAGGRGGLGAVMGAKRLKAVVVHGSQKTPVARPEALEAAAKALSPAIRLQTRFLTEFGTSGSTELLDELGDLPLKNWRGSAWPQGATRLSGIRMRRTLFAGNYACKTCPIACGKSVKITEGPYQGVDGAAAEYESVGTLGSLCLVDDLGAVEMANQLCNQYGMDTISAGSAVAFAMEAAERGLLSPGDADGLDLRWGNAEALVELVRRIGQRRGLGRLLGEGVRRAAERLGGEARQFAMEVKGMELPAHDPRAFFSLALGYATSNRGACHLQAFSHPLEGWINLPELGYHRCPPPHTEEGKAAMVASLQDLMCLFDALKICKFSLYGGVQPHHLLELLNAVTGWDIDLGELMRAGERAFNLKRLYNASLGVSRADDTLPARLRTLPRETGGAAGCLPDLERMLREYYPCRGWDERGLPTPAKLQELGLDAR